MDEIKNKLIIREANKVKELISGAQIFGEPVDMDNLDMVIYAAYLCGVYAVSHPNKFEDPIMQEVDND